MHDRSKRWIASNLSMCLGKAYYILLISYAFPLNIPYWLLSVSSCGERWIHRSVPVCFVCCTNVEQDDGSCPKSLQPRDNRCFRADFILSFTLRFALSACYFAVTGSMCLLGGQLNSCVLLEGFSNCQRGKTDLACYSGPFPPKCHFALLY